MASQIFIKKSLYSKVVVLAIVLSITTISFLNSCSSTDQESYLNHADDVAYVGMETCKSCHGDKHETFQHTGMGLSFGLATKEKSAGLFGADHVVYDTASNLWYYPFWQDSVLNLMEFRLKGTDTVFKRTQVIDYIVGSGQHTNSHLINNNGFVYQAPLTFYVQEQKWDLPPGFENGNNSRFNRIINVECMSCHNSMPQMEEASEYRFNEVGRGIDCERCHGPGELHVQQRLKGEGVDVAKEIDYTIVNPRKLDWERQIDVCQRCHLQGLNILKDDKSFTDFKPGMTLSDVFEIYLPQFNGENMEFDMANHSDRLQKSQCFIQSNKGELSFTCITCHNPHVSVKQTGNIVYNSACLSCHKTKEACSVPASEMQAAEENCVGCHMPTKGTEDIPHVSVHDHYIRKPVEEKNKVDAKLIGLYAVNNASPDPYYLTKAYLEYWEKFDKNTVFLEKAKQLLDEHGFADLWLKYYYLTENYDKATAMELEDSKQTAWNLFMLGFSYAKRNKGSQAIYYLEQSANKSPVNPLINKELLKSYRKFNKLNKGEVLAEELVVLYALDAEVFNESAKILALKGELKRALVNANRAYELDGSQLDVWETLMNIHLRLGNKKSSEKWAAMILAEDSNHPAKSLFN